MCLDLDGEQEVVQSVVDEVLASCNSDEDGQMIHQWFAGLRVKLYSVKNVVECKRTAYDVLLKYSQLRAAARATTARIRDQIKDDKLTAEELSDLQSDLDRVRSDLIGLDTHRLEMETLLTEAGITVRDRDTEIIFDVKDDVKKLLSCVESDERKLKLCLHVLDLNGRLSEAISNLDETGVIYLDDVGALMPTVKVSCLYVLSLCHFLQCVRIACNADCFNSQRISVCPSVRLSVCPSVTFHCFVQTNEDTIVWSSASGRTVPSSF